MTTKRETRTKLTRKQSMLLVQVAGHGAVTVETLWEWNGHRPGKIAIWRRLATLEKMGLISRDRLHPEWTTQSKHYWFLTLQGAIQAGAESLYEPRTPQQAQELLPIRGRPGKGLSQTQVTTLTLLSEMQQLTTEQINSYLTPQRARSVTRNMLSRLRVQQYITSTNFTEGRRVYWTITEKGAGMIDRPYAPEHRRMPSPETLAVRQDKLAVRKQVESAGWHFIDPRADQADGTKEVQTILMKSVLQKEREELLRLMGEHRPLQELEERVERHNRGDVGLIVPESLQDCLAYRPGLPTQTVVLMINPAYANENYWLRKPHTKAGEWPSEPRSERYKRLTEYLPVYVVVQSPETLAKVSIMLEGSGYRPVLLSELSKELKEQYRGALRAAQ